MHLVCKPHVSHRHGRGGHDGAARAKHFALEGFFARLNHAAAKIACRTQQFQHVAPVVLLSIKGPSAGNQVAQAEAACHIDRRTGQARQALFDKPGTTFANQINEKLLLGLTAVEVVAHALHGAVDQILDVFGKRQPIRAGQQEQHAQAQQCSLFAFRATFGMHPVQQLHIAHAVLLEGKQHRANDASRPAGLVALVVDELGFVHRPARKGFWVRHAGIHRDAIGCNERGAAVELLGRREQFAPHQRHPRQCVVAGRQ